MRTISGAISRASTLAAALVAGAALAGCASTMSTRVTSFQQWPADAAGQSYQFTGASPEQANNLEYRTYEDLVRANIGATGLVESRAPGTARFDVSFDYGSTPTQILTQQPYDPYFYGGFGGIGRYGPPGWGWGGGFWGPNWVTVPVNAYRNTLNLRISDRRQGGAEVYRSSASTVSGRPDFVRAMPYLMRAIFDDFPGNNGSEREIEFPIR